MANKIDLHIHTRKIAEGDPSERNINDADKFASYLREAGVTIGAITNHNMFDKEQFKKFRAKGEKYYTLLPGIEIDFKDRFKDRNQWKRQRAQLNVIFNNDDDGLHKVCNLADYLKEKDISSKKLIPIDDLLNLLKKSKSKLIIYVDCKSNPETKISEDCVKHIKEKLSDQPIIHDVNNAKTHRVLMAHNITSLIGSDNNNWDDYVKKSEKLLESHWPIDGFDNLHMVLNSKNVLDSKLFKNLPKEVIKINIDGDKLELPILKEAINVIIGDKATGKSAIIENIKNSIGRSNVSYFSEDGKKEEFEDLMKKDKIIKENEKLHSQIKSQIKTMLNLKRKDNNCPDDFWHDGADKTWGIINAELYRVNTVDLKDLKNLREAKKDFKDKLQGIIKNNELDEKLEFEIKKFLKNIDKVIGKIDKWKLKKNSNILSRYWSDRLIEAIRIVVKEERGSKTNDLSVGLLNLHNYIAEFDREKNKIKTSYDEFQEYKVKIEDDIPTIGRFTVKKKDSILPLFHIKNVSKKKKNAGKHGVGKVKEGIKVFSSTTDLKNIKSFRDYWEDNNNLENGFIFSEKKLICDAKGKGINFSSGQQSIFLLARILNTEKDWILLDEPSCRIGSASIMRYVGEKIIKLRRGGKTIIIATHNPNLGINVLPNKYFLRTKDKKSGCYYTWQSYIFCDYFLDKNGQKESSPNNEYKFNKIVKDIFEGGEDSYDNRQAVYEAKI